MVGGGTDVSDKKIGPSEEERMTSKSKSITENCLTCLVFMQGKFVFLFSPDPHTMLLHLQ